MMNDVTGKSRVILTKASAESWTSYGPGIKGKRVSQICVEIQRHKVLEDLKN